MSRGKVIRRIAKHWRRCPDCKPYRGCNSFFGKKTDMGITLRKLRGATEPKGKA